MPDVKNILAKPEDFGFTFETGVVKKYGKTSGAVPLVKIVDAGRFEKNFPGLLIGQFQKTSVRVWSQGIVRNAWFDQTVHDLVQLKTRLVNGLLGVKSVSAKYGPGPEDEYYTTPEELKNAWMEFHAAVTN